MEIDHKKAVDSAKRRKPLPATAGESMAAEPPAADDDSQVDDFLSLTKLDMDLSATAGFTTIQLAELYLSTVSISYAEEVDGLKQLITSMISDKKIDITVEQLEMQINMVLNYIISKIPKRVAAVRKCAALLFSGQLEAQAAHHSSSTAAVPSKVDQAVLLLSPDENSSTNGGGEKRELHASTSGGDTNIDVNKEITLKDIRDAWEKRSILLQKLQEMNFVAGERAVAVSKLKCSIATAEYELNSGRARQNGLDAGTEHVTERI